MNPESSESSASKGMRRMREALENQEDQDQQPPVKRRPTVSEEKIREINEKLDLYLHGPKSRDFFHDILKIMGPEITQEEIDGVAQVIGVSPSVIQHWKQALQGLILPQPVAIPPPQIDRSLPAIPQSNRPPSPDDGRAWERHNIPMFRALLNRPVVMPNYDEPEDIPDDMRALLPRQLRGAHIRWARMPDPAPQREAVRIFVQIPREGDNAEQQIAVMAPARRDPAPVPAPAPAPNPAPLAPVQAPVQAHLAPPAPAPAPVQAAPALPGIEAYRDQINAFWAQNPALAAFEHQAGAAVRALQAFLPAAQQAPDQIPAAQAQLQALLAQARAQVQAQIQAGPAPGQVQVNQPQILDHVLAQLAQARPQVQGQPQAQNPAAQVPVAQPPAPPPAPARAQIPAGVPARAPAQVPAAPAPVAPVQPRANHHQVVLGPPPPEAPVPARLAAPAQPRADQPPAPARAQAQIPAAPVQPRANQPEVRILPPPPAAPVPAPLPAHQAAPVQPPAPVGPPAQVPADPLARRRARRELRRARIAAQNGGEAPRAPSPTDAEVEERIVQLIRFIATHEQGDADVVGARAELAQLFARQENRRRQ